MGLDGFSLLPPGAWPGDGPAGGGAGVPAPGPVPGRPDAAGNPGPEAPAEPDPTTLARHGAILAGLGLVYLRHNDAPRAMVLGLAAMAMGHLTAPAVLLVAEAMLVAGDPAQAAAVLTRLDREGGLSAPPTATERAARHYLAARILHREGDAEAARAELARARRVMAEAADGPAAGQRPGQPGAGSARAPGDGPIDDGDPQ